MVKHNNIIPNIHCKKKYLKSSRGPLKVRLSLNSAGKKKSRRLKRAAKAIRIAPRPIQSLRPIIHCPTQRYNAKTRLGRGFTLQEIRSAGLKNSTYARSIGIGVDSRRVNVSVESLEINVERLKVYLGKLVVFPLKNRKSNRKDKSVDVDMDRHVDKRAVSEVVGTVMPSHKKKLTSGTESIVMMDVTDKMRNARAFTDMRVARKESKVIGHRMSVANRKKNEK